MKYLQWLLIAVVLIGVGWFIHDYFPTLSFDSVSSYFTSNPSSHESPTNTDENNGGAVCAQVITPARNPKTGDIAEFPTPCDVPEGWVVIVNDVPGL